MTMINPKTFSKMCDYVDSLSKGELIDICESNSVRRSNVLNMLLLTSLEYHFRDSTRQYQLDRLSELATHVRNVNGY